VAAVVMLEGIAFLAIITAAITSTFIARADREQATEQGTEGAALEERLDARFDELERRFDRLESMAREASK
jgi:hypothetical protein